MVNPSIVSYHDINLYLLHNERGLSVETREKITKLINKNHFKKSVLSNILCYNPSYTFPYNYEL